MLWAIRTRVFVRLLAVSMTLLVAGHLCLSWATEEFWHAWGLITILLIASSWLMVSRMVWSMLSELVMLYSPTPPSQ